VNKPKNANAKLNSQRNATAQSNESDKFAEKGLDERIDHRKLKAQGIDREPTIHLGHKAAALERKGIRTEKGDYNREIKHRNEEHSKKVDRKQNENPEKTAQILNDLREKYTALERNLSELIPERNEIRQELPRLSFRAESIDEHAKNIEVLQAKLAELQIERQNLNFLQRAKKQETDQAIKHAEQEFKRAKIFFDNRFGVNPDQAPEEIKRIGEKVRAKQADLTAKNTAILDIMNNQDKNPFRIPHSKTISRNRPRQRPLKQTTGKT
jgi:hypothetical protein